MGAGMSNESGGAGGLDPNLLAPTSCPSQILLLLTHRVIDQLEAGVADAGSCSGRVLNKVASGVAV